MLGSCGFLPGASHMTFQSQKGTVNLIKFGLSNTILAMLLHFIDGLNKLNAVNHSIQ